MDKNEEIRNEAIKEINNSSDPASLEGIRIKYLGRSGKVTMILRSLAELPLEQKKIMGPKAQALRAELDSIIVEKKKKLLEKKHSALDVTRPGKKIGLGHLHPLSIVEKEIIDIFRSMSFSVIDGGPEVETEHYNFDALNIPENHPAREMHDTFWLSQNLTNNKRQMTNDKEFRKGDISSRQSSVVGGRLLLRTHTSPMQIRYMESHKPPFQIIVPGRVFRYEATDASHEINFNQIECLMVGKDVNLSNFKFIIEEFFSRLFKKSITVRLRPSYFPFVEPGLEYLIQCVKCGGKGCNICKNSGWLEVMGAGMVHPNVLRAGGYDPREYQGFAFGVGPERIAMLKYNIPDIRMFYGGDLRFINQF
ncbi:MAG: phenylalanine--tRNA ligase subunit alpha [Patescibacteria group bacterium]|nr:phenylalanine--tRNA ligase subunit alpha [Patescibacteria group bacterium]